MPCVKEASNVDARAPTHDDGNEVEVEFGRVSVDVVGYRVDGNALGQIAAKEDER